VTTIEPARHSSGAPGSSAPMRPAGLAAVTVDGYGTLLELEGPLDRLRAALESRGVHRSPEDVRAAFSAEVRYYRPRSHFGRDAETLAALRVACARVFLDHLAADLEPARFVDDFMGALTFRPLDGVAAALEAIRELGLRIAVVSNWDCSLPETLRQIGLLSLVDAVVTSAEAGFPKPRPEPFLLALERLGVEPGWAVHVGDEADDERGAVAAGMRFMPAPLSGVVEALA